MQQTGGGEPRAVRVRWKRRQGRGGEFKLKSALPSARDGGGVEPDIGDECDVGRRDCGQRPARAQVMQDVEVSCADMLRYRCISLRERVLLI